MDFNVFTLPCGTADGELEIPILSMKLNLDGSPFKEDKWVNPGNKSADRAVGMMINAILINNYLSIRSEGMPSMAYRTLYYKQKKGAMICIITPCISLAVRTGLPDDPLRSCRDLTSRLSRFNRDILSCCLTPLLFFNPFREIILCS